jgi:hypothetical protein
MHRAYKHDTATLDEWISILRLSHKWSFEVVNKLALRFIENSHMEPLARIQLYHEYGVPREKLIPSYAALIARPEPPTNEETAILGIKTVLSLFRAREYARGSERRLASETQRTGGPIQIDTEQLASFVRETFFTLPLNSPLLDGANDTSSSRSPNGPPPYYPSIEKTLAQAHANTYNQYSRPITNGI